MPTARADAPPVEGYYKSRIGRDAVWAAARIFSACRCTVNGTDESLVHDWRMSCDRSPRVVGMMNGVLCEAEEVWNFGSLKAITKDEYDLMLAQTTWDQKYAPESANAQGKVDFNKLPIPKF